LEDVMDQSGFGISNITIDWGDGSAPDIIENGTVAKHTYSDSGDHIIQVRAANAIGMRTTVELNVDVEDDDPWEIAGISGWMCVGTPLLLLIILALVLLFRMRKEDGKPFADESSVDTDVVWETDPSDESEERGKEKEVGSQGKAST